MSYYSSTTELLKWYIDAGINETISDIAISKFITPNLTETEEKSHQLSPTKQTKPSLVKEVDYATSTENAIKTATELANSANTLTELEEAITSFDGCSLKKTALNTVFARGNPSSQIMLVGEAPGKDEDKQGLPFVGASGQLLDKMLASIGLDKNNCYISNVLPWRPPGNRTPTSFEIGICLPFIQRHIEIINPNILILLGGSSASAILAKNDSVNNLRNQWHEYETTMLKRPIDTIVTFHPAYLLRTPHEKRKAWQDLLKIAKKIEETNLNDV